MSPDKAERVRNLVAEIFNDNFLDLPEGSCSIGLVEYDKKHANLYAYPPVKKMAESREINIDWDGCDVEVAYKYHAASDQSEDWYELILARFVVEEESDGHTLYKFSENLLPYLSGYAECRFVDKIIDKERGV